MTKIRVNAGNSKVVGGKLFITLMKAMAISSKESVEKLIDSSSSVVFPGLGKLVEYKGSYSRS